MMFERDPEELGPESYEDTTLRMDMQQSIHTFDPGPDGRCRVMMYRSGTYERYTETGIVHEPIPPRMCGSTQRSSVFHDDEEAYFREQHWHGGGDCMCFENEY
jgi:hypothetical protein